MTESDMQIALARAIELAGGVVAVARGCGCSPQAVSQWRITPAKRAATVEQLTAGVVTRYELRPDIFGSASR